MDNRKIILIVDDGGAACDELRDLIANVTPGLEVLTAGSGAEARKALAENEPALALLDYKLPDTTGLELLKEIKAKNAETPVILITGAGSIESGVEAMKEGAHDYILKPFHPEKIEALVRRLLEITNNCFILKNNGEATFNGGAYRFACFEVSNNANLIIAGSCEIYLEGSLVLGMNTSAMYSVPRSRL